MKFLENIFFYFILSLYNVFLIIFFIIAIPFILIKKTKSYTLKNIKKRFIFEIPNSKNGKRKILFHASSIGELNSIKPLIEKFLNDEIIITTFTETALSMAKNYGKSYLMPFDFYFIVLNFFKKIKPEYVFIAETEIWPNFIIVASKFSKIYWINARMSEKSFKYYKFFSYFIKKLFEKVEKIFVQDMESFERFKKFIDTKKLVLCGNTKFDSLKNINFEIDFSDFLKKINFDNKRLITFGSIHPDEFETIIKSFIIIRNDLSDIRYIVVPRHIEKIKFFEDLLKKYNIKYAVFEDALKDEDPFKELFETEVLLVNRTGILLYFYKISSICFVGGTLNKTGGHNLLEPSFFSKPVLFGPNYSNQKEAAKKLIENRGGFVVGDEYDIKARIKILLEDRKKLEEISNNSKKSLEILKGATELIMKEITIIKSEK